MRSTRAAVGVGSDAQVQAMVDKQLAVRECLPKAANGAHKAPSSAHAAQILKDMRQGVSKEYARLFCVAICNLEDGAPIEQVEAPILMLLGAIRVHARPRTDRPLLSIITRETKAQGRLDLAQLRVANSPTSLEAIDEAIAECEGYKVPFRELEDTLREQRMALSREPRPSRHLTLHS